MSFSGNSASKESVWNAGDPCWIPGLGRSPGGEHGNPLQYSCQENPHGQRSLAGYSPWDHKEVNRHMKRCLTVLIIREMQIKTTRRYHLTQVRMAIIKKSANNKCWRGCEEKGSLLPCWWECKLVQPLWKTVWKFLKKLKIELSYDPTIPLRHIHRQNYNLKRYLNPNVHSSTIHNSQDMETI